MTTARDARTSAEALVAPSGITARDARTSAETLLTTNPTACVARNSVEVLINTATLARNSRTSAETLLTTNPTMRNSRTSIEVLIRNYVQPTVAISQVNIIKKLSPPLTSGGTLPRFKPAIWNWAVGDWHGPASRELPTISGRTLTVKLQDPDTASFSMIGDAISHDNPNVTELMDDLTIWRNGKKLFRGRIGDSNDNVGDNGNYTVGFTAYDYRDILDYHVVYINKATAPLWPDLVYAVPPFPNNNALGYHTLGPPEDIIWDLLKIAQSAPNADLGITKGIWANSGIVLKEAQKFQDGDKIWSTAIRSYVTSSPGVDFYIDPDKQANVYLQRGSSHGAVLDYGGVISKFQRTFTRGSYANLVRQSGSDPLLSAYFGSDTSTTRPEGSWTIALGDTTLQTQEAVTQVGTYNYLTRSAVSPGDADRSTGGRAYQVTFAVGAWQGPDHVWVGDTVRLLIKRGRLLIDDVLRVYEMSISIDQSGIETVTATLNWPTNPDDKLQKLVNTIWTLNRR